MPRESDTLNEHLRRFREGTKGTKSELMQADIALAIDKSQSLLSKIERGLTDLSQWPPTELYELLLAYRQTPATMLRLAETYHLPKLKVYIEKQARILGVEEKGARVRYLGIVSAGMLGASEILDGSQQTTVSAPDIIVQRYRLEDVFAVNVVGDSMLDELARDSISPGSLVFFHAKLAPEFGEIVCVYLPGPDQTVIKSWRHGHGYAVLASRNAAQPQAGSTTWPAQANSPRSGTDSMRCPTPALTQSDPRTTVLIGRSPIARSAAS